MAMDRLENLKNITMFSSTKTVTSMSSFSERAQWLKEQIANADYILIGAGSGLSASTAIIPS